jgi:VCBS repeat protein/diheme cytochrome c
LTTARIGGWLRWAVLASAGGAALSGLALAGRAAAKDDPGEVLARRLCASCHPATPPSVLPRASWRGVLEKMALIAADKDMPGWGERRPPVSLSDDYAKILAWYEANAPAALPAPEAWPPPDPRGPRFVRRAIGFKEALTPEPAVSNVLLVDLEGDGRLEALATDMRQGALLLARPYDPAVPAVALASLPHPAHVAVADVDADGRRDLLVADLGEFYPGDHERGAVFWLRGLAGGGLAPPAALHGLPRLADAEAADFDGDGKPDLAVAAFGWRRKGQVAVLPGRSLDWGRGTFERVVLDPRAGAIHVVPADLDGDGTLDLLALVAQEHEAVMAYLGDGKGGFRPRVLYAAPHPNWGSSGLQLVDLDGDGDQDVLVTNGDMFDDDLLKPYHGIQWLENRGQLRFEPHWLASLPGAHRAVAADLDGDGDRDVVASAFVGAAAPGAAPTPSLVWLEQVKRGRFERHTLAAGPGVLPTLDVGDVDQDGDLDIVAGRFLLAGRSEEWLEVWENQRLPKPAVP